MRDIVGDAVRLGAARQAIAQRLALDELEHEVARAVDLFEAVNTRDVGVREGSE
jgi:hypothetical protein